MSGSQIRVIVFENNATRAELYAHWLADYDVEVALTPRQAVETFDETHVVAILDEQFGDGAAPRVLELIRSRNPECRVITTSPDRNRVFPSLDVDNHMAKPLFEDDLCERVDRLARRAVYGAALTEYYRVTLELTSLEHSDDRDERSPAERERLESRAARLKATLAELTADMDEDDVSSVLDDLTAGTDLPSQAPPPDSKYVPPKCPRCRTRWDRDGFDGSSSGPIRIGSFVWRCGDCGHVQMHASPSDGRLAPFL